MTTDRDLVHNKEKGAWSPKERGQNLKLVIRHWQKNGQYELKGQGITKVKKRHLFEKEKARRGGVSSKQTEKSTNY